MKDHNMYKEYIRRSIAALTPFLVAFVAVFSILFIMAFVFVLDLAFLFWDASIIADAFSSPLTFGLIRIGMFTGFLIGFFFSFFDEESTGISSDCYLWLGTFEFFGAGSVDE